MAVPKFRVCLSISNGLPCVYVQVHAYGGQGSSPVETPSCRHCGVEWRTSGDRQQVTLASMKTWKCDRTKWAYIGGKLENIVMDSIFRCLVVFGTNDKRWRI